MGLDEPDASLGDVQDKVTSSDASWVTLKSVIDTGGSPTNPDSEALKPLCPAMLNAKSL